MRKLRKNELGKHTHQHTKLEKFESNLLFIFFLVQSAFADSLRVSKKQVLCIKVFLLWTFMDCLLCFKKNSFTIEDADFGNSVERKSVMTLLKCVGGFFPRRLLSFLKHGLNSDVLLSDNAF